MGAWRYVRLKAEEGLGVRLEAAGRAEGAAPAAGSPTLHAQEQHGAARPRLSPAYEKGRRHP